jgi:hypothetical protein
MLYFKCCAIRNRSTMKDEKDKRERQNAASAKKQPKDPGKDPRQDRLKLALRENLKRRKSQARGRSDIATASSGDVDVTLHDGSEKKPNG